MCIGLLPRVLLKKRLWGKSYKGFYADSLQKFKQNIASSVITKENSGISSMDTDQILDLFQVGGTGKGEGKKSDTPQTQKEILDGLEELWDESQYDDFDTDAFLASQQK